MSLKSIIDKIQKSEFTKHVLTLFTGTAIAQVIPVVISPILTRLYSPEEIGAYTIFFATSNILAILVSGRLEFAVIIPKKRKEGLIVFSLSFFYSLLVFFILLVFIFFFNTTIAKVLGLENYSEWLFIIPFLALLIAIYQIISYWLNRENNYKVISQGKIIQGIVTGVVHVSVSILSALGLVLGRVIGVLLSVIFMILSKSTFNFEIKNCIKARILRKALLKYKIYPLITMPNALLNSTSNNLPSYMLESLYSLQQTGFYAWSVKIVQGPMGMLISSLQQVFFKKASETYNKQGNLFGLVLMMYKKLFIIGIVPYVLLFIFAPYIFEVIFGEEWRVAGEYTTYLVPWLFVVFLNSPVSGVMLILNKQKKYFIFELSLFLSRLGALFGGYCLFNQAKYSIILYGIVGLIFNIFLLCMTLKISRRPYD